MNLQQPTGEDAHRSGLLIVPLQGLHRSPETARNTERRRDDAYTSSLDSEYSGVGGRM